MFIGAVPRPLTEQMVRAVPFGAWGDIYVCCSGSFRIEQAIGQAVPGAAIHANDVALYSTVIARAALRQPFPLRFEGKLAFIESIVGEDFQQRAAAVLLAHEMSRYTGNNAYSRTHFAHYEDNFPALLTKTGAKLAKMTGELRLATYTAGDLSDHVDTAIRCRQAGEAVGLVTFPPTYANGYEKMYKFLDASVSWAAPSYAPFHPKTLIDIVARLEQAGVPYCILTDQEWETHHPQIEYTAGRQKPIYGYVSSGRATVRHIHNKATPFRYSMVDPAKLTPRSRVEVIKADAGQMNFLKDVYLSKSIVHSTGMYNFLVLIDGALVGGLIFSKSKYGGEGDSIYLLSDVAVSSEAKLSKLVALIATSRTLFRVMECKLMTRLSRLSTTAFSQNPVSMKYRDIYKQTSRRPADDGKGFVLQYESEAREQTPQQMYDEWFVKHGPAASPALSQKGARRRGTR